MSVLSNFLLFLNNNRYNKADALHTITHVATKTSKTNKKGSHVGSYYIPVDKLQEFYKLYKLMVKGNYELNMIEKHEELSPILIDFDFKFTVEHGLTRLHTKEIIKNIVNAYVTEIKNIWNVKDTDLISYVFERNTPYYADYENKQIVKDGLHIIFPYIVSTPNAQYYLRNKILLKMPDILKSLQLINDIEDVVDKAVIYSNGWFIYGSCKPDLASYELTYIYNDKLEQIKNTINTEDLPEFLSIRNKKIVTPLLEEVEAILLKEIENSKNKEKNKEINKNKNINSFVNIETDEYKNNVLYLVTQLNNKCWKEYDTWRNIIWFMYKCGISEDIIDNLCVNYDGYTQGSVNRHLQHYDKDKCDISIGTIFFYLKEYGCDIEIYNKCVKLFKNVNIIPLEDINANEKINCNNIGSYVPRLEQADIVCLRSNMMTYKTQNLKELVEKYKRIVIVSFRVSLDEAYIKEFGEFDFKLYSDIQGKITDDRVVVQIDSLHRLRGKCDLLILDEIVYSLDHLISFVKQKKLAWDTLKEYIKESSKIIVCDALLNNSTIQLFKDLRSKVSEPDQNKPIIKRIKIKKNNEPKLIQSTLNFIKDNKDNKNNECETLLNNLTIQPVKKCIDGVYIVDNEWKSFDGYTADIIINNSDLFIFDVYNLLNEGKKVVVPISSVKQAEKLKEYVAIHLPLIKTCFISEKTGLISPTEWNKYDLLLYTPTIAAGISFNEKYFDNRICYFSNQSCSAELATQMIFRVRNLSCKNIKIYVSEKGNIKHETESDKIDKMIRDIDALDCDNALNVSRVYDEIIKDEYYYIYKNYLSRCNMSKNNFAGVLCGILEAHGVKTTIVKKDIPDEIKTQIQEIKTECKEISKNNILKDASNVANAKMITNEEYNILSETTRKSAEDKLSLRKYHILKTYGDRELTPEFVSKYEKLVPKYYNICEFANPNFAAEIKEKIQNKDVSTDNVKRLHKSNRDLKLYWVHEMIKMIGFTDIFDTKNIKGFPYEKIKNYLTENGEKVALLFNTNKRDWKSTELNEDGKKLISKYINDRLRDIVNISIVNKYKGKSRVKQEYIISGIDEWEKDNIIFIQKELDTIDDKDMCLFDYI
jgi:hypothetical protein